MTMSDEDLRRRVAAAYDDVLDEPVPGRLSAMLAAPKVVDLAAQREKRRFMRLTWAQLGGMAAAVLVGIGLGWQFAPRDGEALVAERNGHLVAASTLARALDTQLAADSGDVAVQLTFVDQGGRFCRTFAARQLAGLTCREDGQWSVVATARTEAATGAGMRQAASALPRPVLDAVDARIAGPALDAAKEKQARDAGWSR
ncbi:hypothetical protein [Ramlibacter sp. PS4R-6]|uniref:hypothetical protein n=1 Tax=Ramlibacter sp. PS4R-6 TaxID=3133438 RepID=UPI0030A76785